MMRYAWGYGPWMMGGGLIMMLFTLLVFGLAFYFIFRKNGVGCCGSHHIETKNNTALEILKERYAKGEISTEEFHERKKQLE